MKNIFFDRDARHSQSGRVERLFLFRYIYPFRGIYILFYCVGFVVGSLIGFFDNLFCVIGFLVDILIGSVVVFFDN